MITCTDLKKNQVTEQSSTDGGGAQEALSLARGSRAVYGCWDRGSLFLWECGCSCWLADHVPSDVLTHSLQISGDQLLTSEMRAAEHSFFFFLGKDIIVIHEN